MLKKRSGLLGRSERITFPFPSLKCLFNHHSIELKNFGVEHISVIERDHRDLIHMALSRNEVSSFNHLKYPTIAVDILYHYCSGRPRKPQHMVRWTCFNIYTFLRKSKELAILFFMTWHLRFNYFPTAVI